MIDSRAVKVSKLTGKVAKVLAGHPPEIQGATLADCLSIWLAGHPRSQREELLEMHIAAVVYLIPYNEPPEHKQ